jgi:hypothetical protein
VNTTESSVRKYRHDIAWLGMSFDGLDDGVDRIENTSDFAPFAQLTRQFPGVQPLVIAETAPAERCQKDAIGCLEGRHVLGLMQIATGRGAARFEDRQ